MSYKLRQKNTFYRKIKLFIFTVKEKSRSSVFLTKFFASIVLTIIILVVSLTFAVSTTYQRRTISSKEEIPVEIRNGILIVSENDINYSFDNTKELLNLLLNAYYNKRITNLGIVIYSAIDENSKELLTTLLKNIPSNNYNINTTSGNLFEACKILSKESETQKIVLTGFKNVLPFSSYICSNLGIYVKPFLPKDYNFINNEINFNEAVSIVFKTIFSNFD